MAPLTVASLPADMAGTLLFALLLAPLVAAGGRSRPGPSDPLYVIVAGLATAVGTLTLLGAALSVTVGATFAGWSLGLAVIDIAIAVALLRNPTSARPRRRARPRIGRRALAVALLALAVTAASLGYSVRSAHEQYEAVEFTQLWMVPEPGEPDTVRVGVRNLEGEPVTYRLTVSGAGTGLEREVSLNDGGRLVFALPVDRGPQARPVHVVLYREGEQTPYREVEYWTRPA